jgi:uncharacterized HAD superfamily protein
MKKVLLDLDGVVADFYYGFATFLNKNYGCNLDVNVSPYNYNFNEWGEGTECIDINKAINIWILDGGFRHLPAFNMATKFVNDLKKICDLYIVTARMDGWKNKLSIEAQNIIKVDTEIWLKKHNMPTNNLYFIKEKVPFCKINEVNILIEDKLETALEASKEDLHTILINMNYNSSPIERYKIYRVSNLSEAFKLVKKLIQK